MEKGREKGRDGGEERDSEEKGEREGEREGGRERGGERGREREREKNLKGVNKVLKLKVVGDCWHSCAPSSPPLYICECMCASEKTSANVAFMKVCMRVRMHTST